jgi:cytochrome c oxidase subunit 2
MFKYLNLLKIFFVEGFIIFGIIKFSSFSTLLDAPFIGQYGFQESATPVMHGINHFHNHIFFFLILIGVGAFWLLFRTIFFFTEKRGVFPHYSTFTHATFLEIVWTILPAIILIIIALPSFSLLYAMEEMLSPVLTIKIIARQWYWEYEFSNYSGLHYKFDSYMLDDNSLNIGFYRLLEVDNRLYLPQKTRIRLLITSGDVLHSWCVPSFGVKVDACPGRINQIPLYLLRVGTFYGQCSEICGVSHGAMPIVVTVLPIDEFTEWYKLSVFLENINIDKKLIQELESLKDIMIKKKH